MFILSIGPLSSSTAFNGIPTNTQNNTNAELATGLDGNLLIMLLIMLGPNTIKKILNQETPNPLDRERTQDRITPRWDQYIRG